MINIMKRKFRWELSSSANDVCLLIKELDSKGILCLDDKLEIKVEADYSFSVVYTTDEDNESTDEDIMEAGDEYGFDCEME